jgi:NAD-dependent DNA ligase
MGLARGLIADGELNDTEIEYLEAWLAATEGITSNPIIADMVRRINEARADGIIDEDEREEIAEVLKAFSASDFELGEALKSTTLPLCAPPPEIDFSDRRFTFTGTFVYGSRKDCELAVIERGANAGSIRKDTDFLVIGEYASDNWVQSSYGRKIEKAVEYRDIRGLPLRIISEAHWQSYL